MNSAPPKLDQTIVTPHLVAPTRILHVQQGRRDDPLRVKSNQYEIDPVTREDALEQLGSLITPKNLTNVNVGQNK